MFDLSKYANFNQSRLLKQQGLIQPTPEPGQIWWNEFGFPSLIISVVGDEVSSITQSGKIRTGVTSARISEFHRFYYAPKLEE